MLPFLHVNQQGKVTLQTFRQTILKKSKYILPNPPFPHIEFLLSIPCISQITRKTVAFTRTQIFFNPFRMNFLHMGGIINVPLPTSALFL